MLCLPGCEISQINKAQNKSPHNKTSSSPWASPWVRFPSSAVGRQSQKSSISFFLSWKLSAAVSPLPSLSWEAGGSLDFYPWLRAMEPFPALRWMAPTQGACQGIQQHILRLLPIFVSFPLCVQPPVARWVSHPPWGTQAGSDPRVPTHLWVEHTMLVLSCVLCPTAPWTYIQI